MLADTVFSGRPNILTEARVWRHESEERMDLTESHASVPLGPREFTQAVGSGICPMPEQKDIGASELLVIGKGIIDTTPAWTDVGRSFGLAVRSFGIGSSLDKLVFQNAILKGQLRKKEMLIEELALQIKEIERKKEILSVKFELPDDYYENDTYLLE